VERSTSGQHTALQWHSVNSAAFSGSRTHVDRPRTSIDVMRRAFVRMLGITPCRYRELAEHSTGE
jgi:hypothetical protein